MENYQVPNFQVSDFQVSDFQVRIPSIETPGIEFPDIAFLSIEFQSINYPSIEFFEYQFSNSAYKMSKNISDLPSLKVVERFCLKGTSIFSNNVSAAERVGPHNNEDWSLWV